MKIVNRIQQWSGLSAHVNFGVRPAAKHVPSKCQARVAGRWAAAINLIAPFGYEDASGFHHGFPAKSGN
jgi:hypothetical protein